MFPFLPPPDLSEQVIQELERLVGSAPPFDFKLTRLSEFDHGVVYLEPEPAEPFVRLTGDIGSRFGLLPFAGEFGDVPVPHLTLAMPQLHSVTQRMVDQLAPLLPIKLRAEQAWLMVGDNTHGWERVRRMPFAGVSLRELTEFFSPRVDVVESPYGFSVEIAAQVRYPAVTMRYVEGPRSIEIWAEAMAAGSRSDFILDPWSIRTWSPPHESELVDDATREVILARVEAALEFAGYKSAR